MNSAVGFSLFIDLDPQQTARALEAQSIALKHRPRLNRHTVTVGVARLEIWGHNHLEQRIHCLPDGTLFALIGSPEGTASLAQTAEQLRDTTLAQEFEVPWEGRVILLRITPDGRRCDLWNDWLGSMPVYHTQLGTARLLSTLEPVTVAGAGYTPDDFFLPGLISLLVNGHFISDWALYKNMFVAPPDSVATWDAQGFRAKKLWTVEPSQSRWEAGWDDLVDEMYQLSHQAIAKSLATQPAWVLTLSSGLDSRLIAAVAAEVGANVQTFAWGGSDTTDVNYSRVIAKTLGLSWRHVPLAGDFLARYTPHWAAEFGTAMPFHGMYQMCFFETIEPFASAPVISGFLGDVLAGDSLTEMVPLHTGRASYQVQNDWYSHWSVNDLRAALKRPQEEALEANRLELLRLSDELPGAFFQKMILLEAWSRQRGFTSFQSRIKDYWSGVATPFLNRDYARFCLSLPRAVLDERRLLQAVFRRYYGRLAVIPGTYGNEPMILTGKYLLMRRIAERIRPAFRRGPLRGFGNVQLRMDIESLQTLGKIGLWPLFEDRRGLSDWFYIEKIEQDYRKLLVSAEDIQPLRRLQTVQTLAYGLK